MFMLHACLFCLILFLPLRQIITLHRVGFHTCWTKWKNCRNCYMKLLICIACKFAECVLAVLMQPYEFLILFFSLYALYIYTYRYTYMYMYFVYKRDTFELCHLNFVYLMLCDINFFSVRIYINFEHTYIHIGMNKQN